MDSFTPNTTGKTDAELFAEEGQALEHGVSQNRSDALTVGGSQIKDRDKVYLNLEEANTILGFKPSTEEDALIKKEGKAKIKDADEGRFCWLLPCLKCSMSPKRGILKGLHRSIPHKQHIIQFWRKQLNHRIHNKKCAICVDGNSDMNITYSEIDEFSNSIAYHLKELKFSDDSFENLNPNGEVVIAFCHPACYEYVVVMLAVLKLGAAILPISVELPAERIAEIIKLTCPVLLIASPLEDELFDEVLTMVDVDIMYVDEIWNMLTRQGALENSVVPFKDIIESPDPSKPYPPLWKRTVAIAVVPSEEHELQALPYDSRAFLNRIKWEDFYFVYFASEYVLLPPAFETIDSIAEVLSALSVGVTLIAYQNATDTHIPEQIFSFCQTYKIRRLSLWPSLLKACLTAMQLFDFYAQQVRSVRYWFCNGGVMRTELAEVFFELMHPLAQLVHMYQIGECAGAVTFQAYETLVPSKDQNFYSRLPVGYPVPNMDVYVLDTELKPVKDGQLGEIYVSGLQLPVLNLDKLPSRNYMKNPFSKHKDHQIMVRTMDYGRILTRSNGAKVLIHEMTRARHHYIDNQIVWLQSVEMYLARLTTLVQSCHCVCYRPNEDDQLILAFCVATTPTTTYADIENELRNILSLHTVPEVVIVAEIPRFPGTGFPDENELIRQYQERRLERREFQDWDKLSVPDDYHLRAAKILCYVLLMFLGVPINFIVEKCWNSPYLAIRRATVTKAAFIVKELHRNRYPIFVDDFVHAESLEQITNYMIVARQKYGYCDRITLADEVSFAKNKYKLEILLSNHRTAACSLLARCLTQRGQLDYYAEVSQNAMRKYIDVTWPIFVSKNLSFIVRKKKEKNLMVGAVLNINWHDEFVLTSSKIPREIRYKLELMCHLETGLTDQHFSQAKTHVIQVCYIGLNAKILSDTEIHGITDKIIRSVLAFGKIKGFEAVVIITYDFFLFDICTHNYGFKVAKQIQVNTFVASDGIKPYALCPDSMVASICYKMMSKVENILDMMGRHSNFGRGLNKPLLPTKK